MSELSLETQAKVARAIWDAELLKFQPTKLKSGIMSPFYLDLRKAQSHPTEFAAIIDAYAEMLQDTDTNAFVAGIPEAATSLASATGYKLERKLLQPRKVIKDHGTGSSIEGDFAAGDSVILLDDLITKGDSKLEAIKQVEDAGLVIDRFFVLVDREQGGVQMVRDAGYNIEAGISITALAKSLKDQDKITTEQLDTIVNFVTAT